MTFQTSALLLSWVAILLLALVVAGLVRQVHALGQGASPRPGPGPAPGTRAPAFERLGPGLLLFLDRDCGVCTDVLAAAGAWTIRCTPSSPARRRTARPGPA